MRASVHGRTRGEWAVLVLFALLVGYRVFVPPVVGLANNGDFGKVFAPFSLDAPPGSRFTFVALKYDFAPEHHWLREYISSEEALAGVAILLNAPFSKPGTFDLRALGVVHVALYLLALYLLQPLLRGLFKPARVVFYIALILLVFADAMYVIWMNTAYMDTGV